MAPHSQQLFKAINLAAFLVICTSSQATWNKLDGQFDPKPPAPYDHRMACVASVLEISKVSDQALAVVNVGQLTTAHNTLEHVRDVLADMRQLNEVVVYSDRMNAHHSQMEVIMVHHSETLAQPKGMLHMTLQAGASSYLAKQLEVQAPTGLKNSEEFNRMLKAVNQSVGALEAALLNQDLAAAKEAASKPNGSYRKLVFNFV